jgi:hypothetical protein
MRHFLALQPRALAGPTQEQENMSPTSNQAKAFQGARRKLALLSAVSLGLAAIPIGLAAPAQAAESTRVCTVTAVKPAFAGHNSSGVKKVDYPIKVSCSKDRLLNIVQTRWEDDNPWTPPFDGNDYQGKSTWTNLRVAAGTTVTLPSVHLLQNTEPGNEEVFHKVTYQEGIGGLWTGWATKVSANTSMPG